MKTNLRSAQLILEGFCVLFILLLWCVFYALVEPPERASPELRLSTLIQPVEK